MSEELWRRVTGAVELLSLCHPVRTLGSTEPQTRKSRFYLVACARRQWMRLPTVGRVLVELAEMFAEAPAARAELHAAVEPIAERLLDSDGFPDELLTAETELSMASFYRPLGPQFEQAHRNPAPSRPLTPKEWRGLAALLYLPFALDTPNYSWVPVPLHSETLLRDVYGNPFRPVHFPPEWRTDTAVILARQMYESREFGPMPILADALQDAGCDHEELLAHCRDMCQRHDRGCWVLDLVLDRK
jgi:hypothetical protein